MIAVDTSALMAILEHEPEAQSCADALENAERIIMSAATLCEALIVAERRNLGPDMVELIDGLGIEIAELTPAAARRAASVYALWGKGIHPASLNFGDCFSYEVAKEHDCPLLFIGEDFSRTDMQSVLPR